MNSIKLKPCPFCGRKMIFYKETYKNMHGRRCTRQYYMHEDYDINQEESCILDDIDMPFTIGAGDARPDTGYIGEYGEKWNRRTAEVKVMNNEAEQILKMLLNITAMSCSENSSLKNAPKQYLQSKNASAVRTERLKISRRRSLTF